ncbi:MAG: hypothetical protein H7Z37_16250 [Pyrinomonadaceae bacterium]|nr:hypothetical protein [Pyrinomonadaceae bacterium]
MPKRRLSPGEIEADLNALKAIEEMSDFAPPNANHKFAVLELKRQVMIDARDAEEAANRAVASARDLAFAAETIFHDEITAAKIAVKAQYGKDSNEVQAIGLKKSSEFKSGRRKLETK